MAFASDTSELFPPSLTPDALLKAPLGFVSPLWAVFSGAALTGVAWWWATQWVRSPLMTGALDKAEAAIAEAPLAVAAATTPVAEVIEPAAAAAETVIEATAEVVAPAVAVIEEVADSAVAAVQDLAEPVVAASEEVVEAVTEPVIDPVIETVVAAELPETAVGGESAPVPPAALASVEEPEATPKPAAARTKALSAPKIS